MKSLTVVVVICALIMIGAAFGHYYLANEQKSAKEASYPNYNVNLYLEKNATSANTTNITKITISYPSNTITIPMLNWLNLSLKAYSTYNFTFTYNNTPLYFSYNGMINNTLSTGFLDSNLTAQLIFIGTSYSGKTNPIILNGGN